MTATHTPGPWTLKPYNNGAYIYDAAGREVTFVAELPTARLIVAAPELLEALQGLLCLVNDLMDAHEPFNEPDSMTHALQVAWTARSKAEGRTL